ncbi:hypothetical protein JRQ81_014258 [Phrynocephalus forsythii]|uniref:Uncharacterized protein n=1 Tax=Phrynocephalus forsythii TaxID=171643 RepID=A0A9Q0XZ01_9SAUR|nr:hypothetical protein JRQ81_014258 [Phrynocephalus forsythii]
MPITVLAAPGNSHSAQLSTILLLYFEFCKLSRELERRSDHTKYNKTNKTKICAERVCKPRVILSSLFMYSFLGPLCALLNDAIFECKCIAHVSKRKGDLTMKCFVQGMINFKRWADLNTARLFQLPLQEVKF